MRLAKAAKRWTTQALYAVVKKTGKDPGCDAMNESGGNKNTWRLNMSQMRHYHQ